MKSVISLIDWKKDLNKFKVYAFAGETGAWHGGLRKISVVGNYGLYVTLSKSRFIDIPDGSNLKPGQYANINDLCNCLCDMICEEIE